ncbi:hypothetical protein [Paraburkholderia sp. D1E]|uniref:hypothetical protein n=1 Tax=Paraburkholderia sp. D1E TaxID=3461398 RepID=UPI004046104D
MANSTIDTITAIEEGFVSTEMNRRAMAYVLSFVSPHARAVAARKAQHHMFMLAEYVRDINPELIREKARKAAEVDRVRPSIRPTGRA